MSKTIELIVLVVLIAVTYYFYKKSKAQADSQKAQDEPKEQVSKYILTVKIEGMMCPNCERHVKRALEAIPGVKSAVPDFKQGIAVVTLSAEVPDETLKAAVEEEGYKVL